tara:strand:- start:1313 stop:1528 length:216 start_codon:yes stop_codon:yes gene_type:complete
MDYKNNGPVDFEDYQKLSDDWDKKFKGLKEARGLIYKLIRALDKASHYENDWNFKQHQDLVKEAKKTVKSL